MLKPRGIVCVCVYVCVSVCVYRTVCVCVCVWACARGTISGLLYLIQFIPLSKVVS